MSFFCHNNISLENPDNLVYFVYLCACVSVCWLRVCLCACARLQAALNNASPGDTIYIPEGTNWVSLTTAVSKDAAKTVQGTNPVPRFRKNNTLYLRKYVSEKNDMATGVLNAANKYKMHGINPGRRLKK